MSRWAISNDGEYYDGFYNTKEEAVQAGIEECDEDLESFWVGETYEPEVESPAGDIIAEHILERIQDDLDVEGGEFAENFSVTDEQIDQLGNILEQAVNQWIKDNDIKPGFFLVRNSELIRVPRTVRSAT